MRLNKSFVIIVFILLSGLLMPELSIAISSDENAGISQGGQVAFVYDSRGRRDPFVAPRRARAVGPAEGLEYIESPEQLKLEGIVWDPGGDSYAFINGQVMRPGQVIGNLTLLDVMVDRVIVDFRAKRLELELDTNEKE